MQLQPKNKAIIFSAPSGAGKTTIVHALLEKIPTLEFSISACSRPIRGNEVNGKDYYFLGVEGFKKAINDNALVEWEEVYPDQFYGTLNSELERIWQKRNSVIFDVDVVGGLNLKKSLGTNALSIFVMPPSVESLEKRLRSRGTETNEKILMRLEKASIELKRAPEFDLIIENKVLNHAIDNAYQAVSTFLKL